MWWRYAIECVVRTIKMKNGAPNQFKLSTVARDALSKQFKHLYSKVFTMKQELKERVEGTSGGQIPKDADGEESTVARELTILEHNALESRERHQYYYILRALDVKTLKSWVSIVVKKHHESLAEAENKRKDNSVWNMFSWMSGSNEQEEEKGELDQSTHELAISKSAFHISEDEIQEIDKIVKDAIEETNEEDANDSNLILHIEYK